MTSSPVTYGPIQPLGLQGWCYQRREHRDLSGGALVYALRDDGQEVAGVGATVDDAIDLARRAVLRKWPGTAVIAPF